MIYGFHERKKDLIKNYIVHCTVRFIITYRYPEYVHTWNCWELWIVGCCNYAGIDLRTRAIYIEQLIHLLNDVSWGLRYLGEGAYGVVVEAEVNNTNICAKLLTDHPKFSKAVREDFLVIEPLRSGYTQPHPSAS